MTRRICVLLLIALCTLFLCACAGDAKGSLFSVSPALDILEQQSTAASAAPDAPLGAREFFSKIFAIFT